MARKQYFCILDTETTKNDHVADIGIIIVDREGKIYNQCAVLVHDYFTTEELFYDLNVSGFWGKAAAAERRVKYDSMLKAGTRQLASVAAVNKWINQAIGRYNPILTAYNLAFDKNKCELSNIDLSGFTEQFCLWGAAVGNICQTKAFKQFALENHAFNNVTEHGNMTFKTNAEIVCGFIHGEFKEEPHTALEDAKDFELPILTAILKKRDWRAKSVPYNWREFQTKNHFVAK